MTHASRAHCGGHATNDVGPPCPDALSGAPIAGKSGGPVLLTAPSKLPAPIATELKRLKPKKIVVLGGAGAVSETVKRALAAYTSGPVDRWAGADRYASSAAFSAKSYPAGVAVAYVASGMAFPTRSRVLRSRARPVALCC